jgi:methylated-DNA-[protein]-cysteine S-methyltransferase
MSTMSPTAAFSYDTIPSPLGRLLLVCDGDALCGLHMLDAKRAVRVSAHWVRDPSAVRTAHGQIDEYFRGERTEFDIPLRMRGTDFQRRVWEALREVRYGETTSYGEIARRIGHPDGARAVGWANGSNPIAVIVPCHRVIGADGSLTGYGGGLERKRLLLNLEARVSGRAQEQLTLGAAAARPPS